MLLRTLISCAALLCAGVAQARTEVPLDSGWRFHFGEEGAAVVQAGFDDSQWQPVSVPHTWNRIGEYATERSPASDNRQGIGWYRLSYRAPAAVKGERHYLDFAGVGNVAEVWVNGSRVGGHKGAFSRFRLDVTEAWRPGAVNLIVVKADNSKPAPGSATADVLPLSGDFFIYGGLYRGVSLIAADDASVDLLDYGGPGVYARATSITPQQAEIAVLTRLRNSSHRSRRLSLSVSIADATGKIVARVVKPLPLAVGARAITQSLTVPGPHLWNGRAAPYLYAVTAELSEANRVIDRVTQPLGIRSFRFDADKGFFLNGAHLGLHGVSRHQDRLGKGGALSRADHDQDMALIEELGANTVRLAHYQHADEWVTDADEAGMVAWAEIPYVSGPSFDGSAGSPAVFANAEQQIRELIRQDYNHPSIMMWSVGNEIDLNASIARTGKPMQSLALLQFINKIAKQEDPFRPTVFADCCEETPLSSPGQQKLAGAADMIGYNRYFGWYYPNPAKMAEQLAGALDHLHAMHPQLPMSLSEYGAGGALSQHSDNPLGGLINSRGRPHPEEYQSWVHEQSWPVIRDRPYLFGTWIWNMFDFASDIRQEGDAIDLNDKGLVTFDRKTRKDAFYFYKATWSDQPVLHINGRRYVDRAYPITDVRIYSNAPTAALSVNGKPLGSRPCPDHICVWPNVRLQPGANSVDASAEIDGHRVTDMVMWTAPDAAAGLSIDSGALVGQVLPGEQRFGSDSFFNGGEPRLLNPASFGPPTPPKRVASTDLAALFEGYREGAFSYDLPLPDGQWRVMIDTFEPDAAMAGKRTFDILLDGRVVAKAVDPARAAGGAMRAATLSFPATVSGGVMKLAFRPQGGPAIVAAIRVMPDRQ
ncbi:MAG: beta-galactosidase [Sphingomonas sp. 28-66-16]|nr:MAG: beta-galactosidase [Sphingomonas sp. 28-66-16]